MMCLAFPLANILRFEFDMYKYCIHTDILKLNITFNCYVLMVIYCISSIKKKIVKLWF